MGSVRLAVLLAAFAVLSTESFAGSHRRPFRSIKAPKETVVNYETVTPVVTYKDSQQVHPRKLHVRVPTRNADYSLVLEQNEAILSGGFTSRHYDEQGKEVVTKGHVNCFYQGWVEDHPDWRVTMSTCHGLQGSFGDMNDENSFFHLEPLNTESSSMDQLHAFYLDSEYKQKQGSCGSNHSHALNEPLFGTDLDIIRHSNHSRLRRQSSSRYVEWAVVNDNRQYIANGRNLSATVLRSISIANEIDQLYRALSIRIVLTDAITWTNGDRISISPNPETLLNTFRSQQRNVISSSYDNAMLITGIDLTGSTVGIAFIGTMCSSTSSVGVTQDGGRSLSSVASTAAHEMGHNFNMNHDETTRQCTCTDGNQGCIMAAISGFPPPTRWSSCSISDLNEGFTTRNTGRCLSNIPTTMVGDPVCGNGIREGNEICDCGSEQECTDPCCNAATCQLASGAQCSAGPCCSSTCQFLSYGSQCRAAIGECDIAEYCPGDSADCPSDDHQLDGLSCKSNTGYCLGGVCPTHNDQCQRAFGSNKGADRCYSITNVRGDQFGNCGHSTSAFIACSAANVQCGQLQCMSGDFLLRGLSVTTLTFTIGSDVCRSFTTQPNVNMDVESPGLVEDGTRCGSGRICMSQQCVALTTPTQCSPAPNGQICSGNGVCNNRGTCSCNVGFTGTNCETPFSGPGGTVNECNTNNGGCNQICTDTQSSFVCSCNSGYTLSSDGRTCVDDNECTLGTHNCQQVCINTNGGFRCDCNSGYRLDSNQRTCSDINECTANTDGCGQICTNTAGSFMCSCRTGYRLGSDGRSCFDINECTANTDGCSQSCTNTVGSFRCGCSAGYILGSDQRTCNDINECTANTDGCGQVCTNTDGSFVCSCDSGYTLDSNRRTCSDIDECRANTDGCSQICTNTAGSYVCGCSNGYSLDNNGRTCSDINECTANTDGCDQVCTNTDGSFECSCNSGFTLSNDGKTCIENNECTLGTDNCQQICVNTNGGFRCECNSGFVLNSDRATCSDIDECASNNGGCQQICRNLQGTFRCDCLMGYSLGSDERSCVDVNECSTNNGGCEGSCSNTIGSFECSCPAGFQLGTNGRTCNNINECNINNGGCNQVCTDNDGSYTCSCNPGFALSNDQRTCTAINACLEGSNNCDQLCSANNDGTFTCSCETGFVLDQDGSSCNDIDECMNNGGGCSGTCQNNDGSFECSCMDGFQLAANRLTCVDINECLQVEDNSCEQLCTNTDGGYICECQSGFMLDADGFTCNPVNGTGVPGPGSGGPGSSGSQTVGAVVGGVIGGIVFLLIVIVVIIVVVVLAMKAVSRGSSKPYKGYQPGYSKSGNGLHHTPSTTRMLRTEVAVDINVYDDSINGDNSTSSFSFTPVLPVSPAPVYKPPPPSYHDIERNPVPARVAPQRPPARRAPPAPKPSTHNVHNEVGQRSFPVANGHSAAHRKPPPAIPSSKPTSAPKASPLIPPSTTPAFPPQPTSPKPAPMAPPKAEKPVHAPRHNEPIKPQPASRPAPAPKPAPVSVSSHEVSAPKPKPKPKPVVPAEKPPVGAVPPKPAVKPAGLDARPTKPAPAQKPAVPSPASKPTSTGGPSTAKKPLAPPTKKPILPPPRQ